MKVVIIGAGASGFAAASRLVQKGFDHKSITILEAQGRIGGRIHTLVENGKALEIGAQWVHGEDNNIVHEMASASCELNQENSWESSGLGEDVIFSYDNGKEIPRGEIEAYLNLIESIKLNSTKELASYEGSLGQYFTNMYLQEIKKNGKHYQDPGLALAVLDWYHAMQNVIDGSDSWFETCGSGHLHYHECPGNPLVTWKRGYSTIFDILLKHIPKSGNGLQLPLSDRVIFNKAVSIIQWNVEGGENPVQLICEDGSTYDADLVVVTCSLGFLKSNAQSLFVPELPDRKFRAIQGLGFGTVDKIYLKFKAPWWKPGWSGVSFLRRRAEHLDAINESLPIDWTKNILGFYTVSNQPNYLVGWVSGFAARTMETLSSAEVLEACSLLLRNSADLGDIFAEPIDVIRSSWFNNPYTLGSYSYRSMESKAMNVFAFDLAKPLFGKSGEPVVLFAGEATHDRFYSTVHGAVESGFREADRILEYLGNLNNA